MEFCFIKIQFMEYNELDAIDLLLLDSLQQSSASAGLTVDGEKLSMRAIVPLQIDNLEGRLNVGALEVSLDVLGNLQQLDRELETGVALLLKRSIQAPNGSGEALRAPVADDRGRGAEVHHLDGRGGATATGAAQAAAGRRPPKLTGPGAHGSSVWS